MSANTLEVKLVIANDLESCCISSGDFQMVFLHPLRTPFRPIESFHEDPSTSMLAKGTYNGHFKEVI